LMRNRPGRKKSDKSEADVFESTFAPLSPRLLLSLRGAGIRSTWSREKASVGLPLRLPAPPCGQRTFRLFQFSKRKGASPGGCPLSQLSQEGSIGFRPDPKRNHDTDAKAEASAQGFRCPGPARRASPRLRVLAQKLAPYADFPLIGLRVGPTGLRSVLGSSSW
jgi:hypothetical protein